MKISMFATGDKVQFNLEPESDHEKKFMQMLMDYTGEVSVHRGVDIGGCQGGYVRNFGQRDDITAITINRKDPEP